MQTNSPVISVVMPVYNGEKFLYQAINSILAQSFKNFEFIIINDGSTDATEDIILSFTDPRIIYIKNEKNLRLIKSLNKGIELAIGTYIARMDADDISLPERFEKQVEIFSKYPDVDIVNANAYHLEEDGKKYRAQRLSTVLSKEAIKYLIPFQNFICHPVVMIKADLLKNYKYVDDASTEHIEDFDLWNRMLADGHVCYSIDEPLLYYRDNHTSINHTQGNKQVERMYLLSKANLKDRFDLCVEEDVLKSVLDYNLIPNNSLIKQIDKQLLAYNLFIKRYQKIDVSSFEEMEFWRRQKAVFFSLKSLVNNNWMEKVKSLIFLLLRLHWFSSLTLRNFLKNALLPKYYHFKLK